MLLCVGGACLLVAAAEGQRVLRRSLRQKRRSRGTINEQALVRWQETVQLARLLGQTPDASLFELAQKAKFSQHGLTDGEIREFTAFGKQCREEFQAKPWYAQFVYRIVFAIY